MSFIITGGSSPFSIDLTERILNNGDSVTLVTRNASKKMLDMKSSFNALNIVESDFSESTKDIIDLHEKRFSSVLKGIVFIHRYRGEDDWLTHHLVEVRYLVNIYEKLFNNNYKNLSIVNFTSPAATHVVSDQNINYHISKSAILAITKYYAVKLGERSIRVNAITPGSAIYKERARTFYDNHPELVNAFKKVIPLKRMGTVEEVNKSVLFLLSSSSEYITGQNICIDGGVNVLDGIGIAHKFSDG